MPVGQPTKFMAEYPDMLKNDMARGFTAGAFAGLIGISRETLYQWIKSKPAMQEAFRNGQMLRQRFWESRLMTAGRGEAVPPLFALKNCCRDDWTDRHEQEVSGPGGKPLTDGLAVEIAAAIAKSKT